jgi:hypothetical protein
LENAAIYFPAARPVRSVQDRDPFGLGDRDFVAREAVRARSRSGLSFTALTYFPAVKGINPQRWLLHRRGPDRRAIH